MVVPNDAAQTSAVQIGSATQWGGGSTHICSPKHPPIGARLFQNQ
jgi:hypothetical protein